MSLFTAYFDDSGTHAQASVAVAACFISTLDKWNVLGKLWNEVNKKEQFGIFHMADFVARTKQFRNWEDSKGDRVIRELVRIIKMNVYVSTMGAVIKADYDAEVTGDTRRYLRQSGSQYPGKLTNQAGPSVWKETLAALAKRGASSRTLPCLVVPTHGFHPN